MAGLAAEKLKQFFKETVVSPKNNRTFVIETWHADHKVCRLCVSSVDRKL